MMSQLCLRNENIILNNKINKIPINKVKDNIFNLLGLYQNKTKNVFRLKVIFVLLLYIKKILKNRK